MKALLFFLFIMPGILMAQPSESLSGQWRGDWNATLNHANQTHKESYDSSDETIRKSIREGISSKRYEFRSDGSLSLSWKSFGPTHSFTGKWSFDTSTRILELTISGASREYTVSFLDKDTIILKTRHPASALLFDQMILVRT